MLAATTLAGPGETVEVTFKPTAPGTYNYLCTFPATSPQDARHDCRSKGCEVSRGFRRQRLPPEGGSHDCIEIITTTAGRESTGPDIRGHQRKAYCVTLTVASSADLAALVECPARHGCLANLEDRPGDGMLTGASSTFLAARERRAAPWQTRRRPSRRRRSSLPAAARQLRRGQAVAQSGSSTVDVEAADVAIPHIVLRTAAARASRACSRIPSGDGIRRC